MHTHGTKIGEGVEWTGGLREKRPDAQISNT